MYRLARADLDRIMLRKLVQFRRREDGGLFVFGLFCLMMMMIMGGLAIDVMRFEQRRTVLQNTIDRAALAAADLTQTADPKSVVKDYFAKAGLGTIGDDQIVVSQGQYMEWRKVEVVASETVPTWFLKWSGVKTLTAPAATTAEERIDNLEVSLVLDVSGSMGQAASGTTETKISLLRKAAVKFVDKMFTNVQGPGSAPGKLSISLVPYAQQVTLGADLASYFSLTNEHTKGTCVDFFAGDFTTLEIKGTLKRTAYADARNTGTSPSFRECFEYASRAVIAWGTVKSDLTARINGLTAEGDTAIDIGAKWGLGLLDPSTRSVLDARISAGKAISQLTGRPYAYEDDESQKVLVLMTDGENTNTYALRDAYKSGPSKVVVDPDGIYFIYNANRANTAKYLALNSGGSYASTCNNKACTAKFARGTWYTATQVGTAATVSYQALWGVFSVRYYAGYHNTAFGGDFVADAINHANNDTKDAQLAQICALANAKGVLVFTVAFEAGDRGQKALKACASSEGYYFNARGKEIETAFDSIANNINILRLTR